MISQDTINQLVHQNRGVGDLGELQTFENINSQCVWLPKDTDGANYNLSSVIGCELVSSTSNDPLVVKTTTSSQVNLTGEYGLGTFDQLSYEFKDIDTNEKFVGSGWPPTDLRAKYMFKLNQDPRSSRELDYVVDFVIEFDYSALLVSLPSSPITPDPTAEDLGIITDIASSNPIAYNFYVDSDNNKAYRKDRIRFTQFIRNFSFSKLTSELARVFE
tara:strand:+ start:2997 stop:3647 length:651 start_codon:yes stop_codon:yes gene_type:complete